MLRGLSGYLMTDKEEGLMKAIEEQVGGSHYKLMKIQPLDVQSKD